MTTLRVAYQGERGAYSEAAAVALFGDAVEPQPHHHFHDVFQAVEAGRADRGVVPIENSLAGSIHRNYDLLLRHELHIVAETRQRIEHCLLALPGVTKDQVRRVHSHPQALDQCEAYLDRLGVAERLSSHDTAGSARIVKERGERDAAAIASRRAATIHGLDVLDEGIEDDPENYTRFLALAREPVTPSAPARTSLVYAVPHRPGALYKSLGVFALWDLNLTKLESRPHRGKPWQYLFYADLDGAAHEAPMRDAIRHLRDWAPFVRLLGSYPAATDTSKTPPPLGTDR